MARPRISLIGAGNIGGVQAQLIVQKQLADVVLFDVVEGLPQGKALDINHALDAWGTSCTVTGTNSYEDTAGSDVYIVTAGLARKPGMSRDDLLSTNLGIMRQVAEGIRKASPDAVVIVVSNPLDAMVYAMKEISGFPPQRVFGQAGVLDSARFKFFVAEALGVAPRDVVAIVLGGHGDTMVPLPRHCSVNGVPLTELMDKAAIDAIVERVQGAGGEVVGLLKTGSAFVSPAAASVAMAESVILDQKRVLPCAAWLDGEYGASGVYMGVPVQIGAGGVERIFEIELDASEKKLMQASLAHVEKLISGIEL
ncbi:MAG: malate dehydrogenase [Deltaproteobacteria bacterium]|nr:malate dehydrogenase [Deltaproteobacteria bacterium]MBW2415935.1 malate dehydrogenase [Deltaproteobacteria bacterium]